MLEKVSEKEGSRRISLFCCRLCVLTSFGMVFKTGGSRFCFFDRTGVVVFLYLKYGIL